MRYRETYGARRDDSEDQVQQLVTFSFLFALCALLHAFRCRYSPTPISFNKDPAPPTSLVTHNTYRMSTAIERLYESLQAKSLMVA